MKNGRRQSLSALPAHRQFERRMSVKALGTVPRHHFPQVGSPQTSRESSQQKTRKWGRGEPPDLLHTGKRVESRPETENPQVKQPS